eukprot:SAG31_NODE_515_length_14710_cov_6.289097_1_plen_81_part_00
MPKAGGGGGAGHEASRAMKTQDAGHGQRTAGRGGGVTMGVTMLPVNNLELGARLRRSDGSARDAYLVLVRPYGTNLILKI